MRRAPTQELALFGTTGYRRDREGLGIYTLPNGTGYIVSVDQVPRESIFHIYRREGEPGQPTRSLGRVSWRSPVMPTPRTAWT